MPRTTTTDRRAFLVGSAAVTAIAGVPLGTSLGQTGSVLVRKAVSERETDPAELQVLRDAIAILRRKDEGGSAEDGWIAVANPHVEHCFTGDENEVHFGWWFWPWHRAYLMAIEKRLQTVVTEPKLRVPYWDWFFLRRLPEAFARETYTTASGATRANPLYDDTRARSAADRPPPLDTDTITTRVLGGFASELELLRSARFSNVGGRSPPVGGSDSTTGALEGGPHNNIHRWIGTDSGNMGQAFSPRDPAFILHHGNVDRLWTVWTNLTTGGAHNNPTGVDWLDHTFPLPHPSGTGVETYRIRDMLDTRQLGYVYDRETIQVAEAREAPPGPAVSIKMTTAPLDLSGGQARTESRSLAGPDTARVREVASVKQGTLVLDRITLPPTNTSVSIYLNSDNLKDNTEENLVGVYTLLNPTGATRQTTLVIPLPDRIGNLIARQSNISFAIVAGSTDRARLGRFAVQEVRLEYE